MRDMLVHTSRRLLLRWLQSKLLCEGIQHYRMELRWCFVLNGVANTLKDVDGTISNLGGEVLDDRYWVADILTPMNDGYRAYDAMRAMMHDVSTTG